MNVTFVNPGVDYMVDRILDFQTEDEVAFWAEPLFYFYPQLDKDYANSLPSLERKEYIARTMRIFIMNWRIRYTRRLLYMHDSGWHASHRL